MCRAPSTGRRRACSPCPSAILAAHETLPIVRRRRAPHDPVPAARGGCGGTTPFEIAFEALGRRDDALGAIEKACRREAPLLRFALRLQQQPTGAEDVGGA
jgi:hypothetical protein